MVELKKSEKNGVTVLRFSGSLTQEEVERIEPQFVAAIDHPTPKIVVDLSKVDSMTTPGISMFVAALKSTAKAGGRIVFTGTRGIVDELLHRCRLDAIMTIVPEPAAAIDLARGGKA